MFGLPGQTKTEALDDIQTAIALNPTHISWYQLTIEPNTLFYHQPPTLPQDEEIEDIFFSGRGLLAEAGFRQYEVSAYAKPNHHSRHNLNYWEFGDYLGIGAGAHAKLTDVAQGRVKRLSKIKHPKGYLAATDNFIADEREITVQEMPFEFMLNTLRLYQPIPLALFEARAGLSSSVITERLAVAEQKGFLTVQADAIVLTELGKRFLNNVIELFL